tara:strand:+ start:12475 stop:12945 length:471 start_codon:yes stop_codon:yes gene_type:complete
MGKNRPNNWPLHLTYISTISYNNVKLNKRSTIQGVKIIILPESHILAGQYALVSTKRFLKFDIIGEYTGIVNNECNRYTAYLAMYNNKELGVDAISGGNEMRFINDYRNICDLPNTKLSVTYIDNKPKILVVVTKDIDEHEEILLDYGEGYWNEFI